MSKPRKPDSRRPSKKKIKKMEERKKAEERRKEIEAEWERYSIPECNTDFAIEQCKKKVQETGKLCFCKEKCSCRSCQERKDYNRKCSLEFLKDESVGCALGCYKCSEHSPCY